MPNQSQRFWYPFTASTVIARRLVPLLVFILGVGMLLWSGREFYFWRRPWAVLPEAALGGLSWLVAGYFFTLLPEVRADGEGLHVRRWGLFWRRIPWRAVAGVRQTAQIDLLGWAESFYTVYVWRVRAGRRGHLCREPHRRQVRAFRFSGHICNGERLLLLVQERMATENAGEPQATP